jgi:p-hydroxybenzoate 3-monooxygenase
LRTQVLIVGSGPSGLLLGQLLAGIGIDNDRCVNHTTDPLGGVYHFGLGQQAEIRFTEQSGRKAVTRNKDDFKTGARRDLGT